MFQALFSKPSYLRRSFQLLTAIHRRNITLSSLRLCDTDNFLDDFREQKFDSVASTNRSSPKADFKEPKSVLFEMHPETLISLESCTSVEEVLQHLKNNPKISFHLYGSVFNTIFKLYKSGKSNLSAENICRTPEMQIFSKYVNKNMRFLKVEDAVTILKVLTYFKISTNSILCQNLLQMISKQVNRLGISQILFLHFIIPKCTRSPLVEALKIALPIVFESHVRSQLDQDDSSTLATAVCFAFKKEEVSDETRKMLVDVALEKIDQFTLPEKVGIVRRLSFNEDGPKNVQNLYTALMNTLKENIDKLESVHILKIIRSTVYKYLNVHESFFDENLIQISVKHFIEKKVQLSHTGELLRQLDKISYHCPELLDYIDEQFKDLTNFDTLSRLLVVSFVKSCSNSSYRPPNWNLYEQKIVSYLEKHKNEINPPILGLVTDLLVLKCWPKALVEYCFQEDYLRSFLGRGNNKLESLKTLSLYHAVKLLYSDYYTGPYPPSDIINKAVTVLTEDKTKQYPLLGALEVGLGGSQYVLNGVKTKLGQIIDYLIVKCKTGELYPINSMNNSESCITSYESLHMPPDSYPIAVVLLSPSSYCLDGLRVRGKVKIILRCLEAYGITAIPISHYQWLELLDHEKIPYLIEKINRSVPVTSSYELSRRNF